MSLSANVQMNFKLRRVPAQLVQAKGGRAVTPATLWLALLRANHALITPFHIHGLVATLQRLDGAFFIDYKRNPLGEPDDGYQHSILARDGPLRIA